MDIMGFEENEQFDFLRVVAAILHIGNISVVADRDRADIRDFAVIERVCHLLGVPAQEFRKCLLTPKIKAGRDWVNLARTQAQVISSLEALAKALYERSFSSLVGRINKAIDRNVSGDKLGFIGVLDIAGFEIFEVSLWLDRWYRPYMDECMLMQWVCFNRSIALSSFVSTIQTKCFNNSSIIPCLKLSKRNIARKTSIGLILTLALTFSPPLT
jgi:Myosin head (motor domain)